MPLAPTRYRPERVPTRTEERGTTAERGYGAKWQRLSQAYLRMNPLCCGYDAEGHHTPNCDGRATQVDHAIPIDGPFDPLFWESSNWRGRSASCHSAKTRREMQSS